MSSPIIIITPPPEQGKSTVVQTIPESMTKDQLIILLEEVVNQLHCE